MTDNTNISSNTLDNLQFTDLFNLDEKNIEISVKDNGIGMSQLLIDNLFTLDSQYNRMGTDGKK